jgi:hypothetical protein
MPRINCFVLATFLHFSYNRHSPATGGADVTPEVASVYGMYLYDRIIPQDHLLRKINQVVDFSFVNELVKDRIYFTSVSAVGEKPNLTLFS